MESLYFSVFVDVCVVNQSKLSFKKKSHAFFYKQLELVETAGAVEWSVALQYGCKTIQET